MDPVTENRSQKKENKSKRVFRVSSSGRVVKTPKHIMTTSSDEAPARKSRSSKTAINMKAEINRLRAMVRKTETKTKTTNRINTRLLSIEDSDPNKSPKTLMSTSAVTIEKYPDEASSALSGQKFNQRNQHNSDEISHVKRQKTSSQTTKLSNHEEAFRNETGSIQTTNNSKPHLLEKENLVPNVSPETVMSTPLDIIEESPDNASSIPVYNQLRYDQQNNNENSQEKSCSTPSAQIRAVTTYSSDCADKSVDRIAHANQPSEESCSSDWKQVLETLKAIKVQNAEIIRQNSGLKEQNRQIIEELLTNVGEARLTTSLYEPLEGFPLSTIEQFKEMESDAKKNARRKLYHHLRNVGGNKLREFLNYSLKECMTDELVGQFTWRGGNKSQKFGDTKIANVLYRGMVHDCYRTCVHGDIRICTYSFTVVEYTTMSRLCGDCPYTLEDCHNIGCITAGGDIRQVTLANHQLPGPSIQVCEGDVVQVDVINALASDSTTIHWHGLYQWDTPWMDGTPYLTQCPIQPHNTFQYNFTAEPAGTHIWHSHSGFEEADGLYGSLIVRRADDPLAAYYDFDLSEHIMVVWHWYYASSASVLKSALHRYDSVIGYSLTINGLAATIQFERDGVNYTTPREEFTVTKGSRYRFRLMYNSALYCPIQVSVDNHTLLVIASESGTFEPVEVDSVIINAGERFDFVLTANQVVDNYWIRYRGLGDCLKLTAAVRGEAILRYNGSDDTNPSGTIEYDDANRSGVLLNPVEVANQSYVDNILIYLVDLNSTVANPSNVSGTPDHTIYLHYAYNYYYEFHSPGPFPQINHASFEFPPIPLLTQYNEITDDMYCTEVDDSAKDCIGTYCTCPYVYPVAANSLVELIVIDLGTDRFDDHPMHLHGHTFSVVAMESIGETISLDNVTMRNEAGLIAKKLEGAPVKDNIGVPAQGFVVLRFIANNPGYWFFHCHVSNHADMGMGVVIKVGEHSEMPQPPNSFPTCGNWNMTVSARSSSSYAIMNRIILTLYLLILSITYVSPLACFTENE